MFNKNSRLVWFAFMCGVVSSAALFADFTHNPAIARYVYIAQAVMSGPSITPDTPTPSSDKCENCDGRGKLGDGRVATICPVCDGTGKTTSAASAGWPPRSTLVIENPDCDCESCDCKNCDCGSCKPIETPRRHNEIDVHTMENCGGCDDWKLRYWSPTERVGWELEECGLLPEHTVAPSFTVWLQGRAYTHSGYMNPSDLQAIMDRHYGRKLVSNSPSTSKRDQLLSTPSIQQWTHPRTQSLKAHLEGWPHNFDTTGLSYSEMKRLHNNHHEEIGPVNAAQLKAKSFNVSSSCPSGNCPTSMTYTRRRGLFGGLFR
ncbi:MAG: hypothetical protein AAGG48_14600 [Planctomycetota bacterium]